MLKAKKFFLPYKRQYVKSGFSIIEVISAIFIFSIVTITIYGSFSAGLKSLAQSKHRVAAAELANEKMEIIRNMLYKDIGTIGGVPAGSIPQNETVWKSNQKFNVHTFIRYVDDAQDGIGDKDENMINTDYKEVKIEVTWAGIKFDRGVKAVSKFVPNGVETNVGGGTFRLNVLDGTGAGITGAEVNIVNNELNPPININTFTDSYGSVLLGGMPAGDRNYEISVSKDNYESVTTLPPYPETPSFDPTDAHASVIENQLNTKAIIIDKLADLRVFSKNIQDEAFPNMDFNLAGGRVIGKTVPDGNDVTNYNENHSTDANGEASITDIPPGKYNIALNEPGYTLIGSDVDFPLALEPGQSREVNLIVASNTENSLIVTVKDSQTNLAVSGASVRLFNGVDFDSTLVTGQMGQVYFPPNTDPPTILNSGNYTLEVTADGYENYSSSVAVNQLTQAQVNLVPIP